MASVLIEGKPIALKRHRVGRGRTYDPQCWLKKDLIDKILPKIRKEGIVCSDKALNVEFVFCFEIPKSYSKKKKAKIKLFPWKTSRPDLSNILKFYEDLFKGILWKDDSQIVSLSATKTFGEKSFTLTSFHSSDYSLS